ncbi:MAG: Bro-N domain-containing protein [Candidatus Methanoperedens sp.]|nr:Bro-N domain-containing protein [Candidatus Methanoperedens sp.]
MDSTDALVVFEGQKIRRTWNNNEWWFVLEDIVYILTDSSDPKQYIQKMKRRDEYLTKGWVQIVHTLVVDTTGGMQKMNCVNTEGAFRIIQSIPSKKAEPFKRWLAKVGYERVQEIEDPELAQKRMKEIYKLKGYSDDWIEKRVRGIAIRDELTDEWDKRGIKTKNEYSILTAEISKAAFGLTPGEYRRLKGLKQQNLRDHMNDLELIFTMLGEASTTKIARNKDALGFDENKNAAKEGGTVAGVARKELELRSGEKVVTQENYLNEPEIQKRLENKKR